MTGPWTATAYSVVTTEGSEVRGVAVHLRRAGDCTHREVWWEDGQEDTIERWPHTDRGALSIATLAPEDVAEVLARHVAACPWEHA